ncbi:MAG: nucleotide exchange factor GrpE, partial [Thermoguttaceae bacterium]|nr:nucleotide exchange factor GrpE [Thermoguttaceae bacterium]
MPSEGIRDTKDTELNEMEMSDRESADAATPFSEELDQVNATLADQAAEPNTGSSPEEVSELETIRAELELTKDRVLRISAELDNYRKRVQREMQEERRYATMPLMRELLPVVDNLKRAIEAAKKSSETSEPTPEMSALLEGVSMVLQQLEGALAKQGCVRIEAMGQPFDPNIHDALLQQPSADAE